MFLKIKGPKKRSLNDYLQYFFDGVAEPPPQLLYTTFVSGWKKKLVIVSYMDNVELLSTLLCRITLLFPYKTIHKDEI